MGWFALTAWIGAFMAREVRHRRTMVVLVGLGGYFGGVEMSTAILLRAARDVALTLQEFGALSAQSPF